MSIITLAETKKVYGYSEVIGQTFSIPIPRDRKYTSPKERNGYKNQTFSSNNMPKTIDAKCFAVTKYSPDGKIHPVCVGSKNLIEEFCLKGKAGFLYGPDELNLLCRIFAGQEELTDVRSINYEDTTIERSLFGNFWLASRAVDVNSCGAGLRVRFVDDGVVGAGYLFYSFGYSHTYDYGVRPVFVLESEVKFPEPKGYWVMS